MKRVLFLILISIFSIAIVFISTKAREIGKNHLGGARLNKVTGTPRATLLNINRMSAWTRADGFSARNPFTGNSGVVFPRGTAGVIFQDGILWGGLVKDGQIPELRVGGSTYISGTLEGAILSKGVREDPNNVDVRIWRIREDWETADLRQDAAEFFDIAIDAVSDAEIATVRAQYGTDWDEWPWQKGAPYYDDNSDGVYDPVNDRPGIAGADQVVWFVRNDLDPTTTASLYGSRPIGMEIQETLWGYARAGALGNMIFKKSLLIYKGTSLTPNTATIEDLFITQWSDPDLGDFGDDFAGSVPELSLGYVYNSSSIDAQYESFGLAPPAVGFDFLQGPLVDAEGETGIFDLKVVQDKKNLPMSSFSHLAAGSAISDPPLGTYEGTVQWYNLMHGLQPATGNPYIDPNTGDPTLFTLSGNPRTGEGWVDGNPLGPGDRKILLTAGPFTMAFQDTQEIIVALIAGIGADRFSSIDAMKFYDISAQYAYNNLFDLPKPPVSPNVSAAGLDNQISLEWGSDIATVALTEGQPDKGFSFEGYNVYQLPNQTSSMDEAVKVTTFDLINEVTVILDPVFDPVSGLVLNLPVQIGRNSDIQRYYTTYVDAFSGDSLINGTEYFFAVTAYNHNPSDDVPSHALESTPVIVTVVPIGEINGFNYLVDISDTISVTHASGVSDGKVAPIAIDPSSFIDASYSVTFNSDLTWNLLRNTTIVPSVENMTNQSGDGDYPIVDGFQIKIEGPPLQAKSFSYAPGTGIGERWFSGASGGGEVLFGAVFLDLTFWGSSLTAPGDYKTVEIRWGGMSSFVDGSGSFGVVNGTYDPGEEYTVDVSKPNQNAFMYKTFGAGNFEGFLPIPFEAWDVDDPANPRQLNVFIKDWSAIAGVYGVGQWDYSFEGGGTPLEYIWIMASDYDATGTLYDPATGTDLMADLVSGPGAVNAYFTLWFGPHGSRAFLADDGVLTLVPNKVNSPDDVFTFTTTEPALFTIIKGDVNNDGSVDVADVILIVNYILGTGSLTGEQEYASDFNNDLTINVADVVKTVRSILGLGKGLAKTAGDETAQLSLSENAEQNGKSILFSAELASTDNVAGIQLEFTYDPILVKPLPARLDEDLWESILVTNNSIENGRAIYLFYSLGGKPLPSLNGVSFEFEALGKKTDSPIEITLKYAVVADANGNAVKIEYGNTLAIVSTLPMTFALYNNYPNPFNPETTISYDVPLAGKVTLIIYNLLGQKVRELVNGELAPGSYKTTWNGRNDTGRILSSGMYFAQLRAEGFVATKKMLLLK